MTMVTIYDFSAQNDLISRFVVVSMVFGVNHMAARFSRIITFCDFMCLHFWYRTKWFDYFTS